MGVDGMTMGMSSVWVGDTNGMCTGNMGAGVGAGVVEGLDTGLISVGNLSGMGEVVVAAVPPGIIQQQNVVGGLGSKVSRWRSSCSRPPNLLILSSMVTQNKSVKARIGSTI